jgi:hypothetical protein
LVPAGYVALFTDSAHAEDGRKEHLGPGWAWREVWLGGHAWLDWGAHRREPVGWARPVWGRARGRQHAGGLARSAQNRSSRSIQVVAISQEGGTEVTLG